MRHSEVLQALLSTLTRCCALFLGIVVRGPGLRVARRLICVTEGVNTFFSNYPLVSGDPLEKDVEMGMGCHVRCQFVFDVCRYEVGGEVSEGSWLSEQMVMELVSGVAREHVLLLWIESPVL